MSVREFDRGGVVAIKQDCEDTIVSYINKRGAYAEKVYKNERIIYVNVYDKHFDEAIFRVTPLFN